MMRIDYLLFGYRIFTVAGDDIAKAADILLKNGVSVRFKGNRFVAPERKARKIESLLGARIDYSKTEILGFYGFIRRNRRRYGIFTAIILTFLLLVFCSDRVWDIRIEGCGAELAEKIENELSECGFSVGAKWSDADTSRIEVDMLSSSESVSWLNINRRGTVAYVSVIEKVSHEEPPKKEGFSNVVASCDAVIEEITVIRGVATVKPGDSVKKGDLLISGVLPGEIGGGFCYADGVVIGRISDSVEVTVSNMREVKELNKPEISSLYVKIFGFSLKIFKINKKINLECDIIDKKDTVTVFDKELPISVCKKYAVPYEIKSILLTAEEMTEEATLKMSEALNKRLANATLVRISTDGGFSDSAYNMISSFVCLEEIGTDLPFKAEANISGEEKGK